MTRGDEFIEGFCDVLTVSKTTGLNNFVRLSEAAIMFSRKKWFGITMP